MEQNLINKLETLINIESIKQDNVPNLMVQSVNKIALSLDKLVEIKKGDRGDTGPEGKSITGPQGIKGEKGDVGSPGRDGVNGKDAKEVEIDLEDIINKASQRVKPPVPLYIPLASKSQLMTPFLSDKNNNTTNTAFLTNVSYVTYLGKAEDTMTNARIAYQAVSVVVAPIWQEYAIYTGNPLVGSLPKLVRSGFANVNNNLVAISRFVDIPCNISKGEHVWLVIGAQATTISQTRGSQADSIGSGLFLQFTGRPSQIASPTLTINNTNVLPVLVAQLT